jgi:hypothetical protein
LLQRGYLRRGGDGGGDNDGGNTDDLIPATRMLLIPKSGRRHQLRVHCHRAGHPIVGDEVYGPHYAPPDDVQPRVVPPQISSPPLSSSSSSSSSSSLSSSPLFNARLMLHAWRLQFPNPNLDTNGTCVAKGFRCVAGKSCKAVAAAAQGKSAPQKKSKGGSEKPSETTAASETAKEAVNNASFIAVQSRDPFVDHFLPLSAADDAAATVAADVTVKNDGIVSASDNKTAAFVTTTVDLDVAAVVDVGSHEMVSSLVPQSHRFQGAATIAYDNAALRAYEYAGVLAYAIDDKGAVKMLVAKTTARTSGGQTKKGWWWTLPVSNASVCCVSCGFVMFVVQMQSSHINVILIFLTIQAAQRRRGDVDAALTAADSFARETNHAFSNAMLRVRGRSYAAAEDGEISDTVAATAAASLSQPSADIEAKTDPLTCRVEDMAAAMLLSCHLRRQPALVVDVGVSDLSPVALFCMRVPFIDAATLTAATTAAHADVKDCKSTATTTADGDGKTTAKKNDNSKSAAKGGKKRGVKAPRLQSERHASTAFEWVCAGTVLGLDGDAKDSLAADVMTNSDDENVLKADATTETPASSPRLEEAHRRGSAAEAAGAKPVNYITDVASADDAAAVDAAATAAFNARNAKRRRISADDDVASPEAAAVASTKFYASSSFTKMLLSPVVASLRRSTAARTLMSQLFADATVGDDESINAADNACVVTEAVRDDAAGAVFEPPLLVNVDWRAQSER